MTRVVVGVTGTGTEVGKTVVMTALALALRRRGLSVDAVKPVATGVAPGEAGDDAELLSRATGRPALECVLRTFSLPRSPHAAAAHDGRTLGWDDLVTQLRTRARGEANVLLIEGVGGVLVPLDDRRSIRDVFRAVDARMIVVGEAGLGTINHTLLTCSACTHAGLRLIGVLLSDRHGVDAAFAAENAEAIAGRLEMGGRVCPLSHVPEAESWVVARTLAESPELRTVVDSISALAAGNGDDDEHARVAAADRAHVWHPFTQTSEWREEEALVVRSGEGCWLIADDGRRYLDGVASLWANVHGHAHPQLDRALHEQAGRIAHSTFLGLTHEPGALLAEELCARAPSGLTRVFYSDSGAAAVEVALRMALLAQRHAGNVQRTRFLSLLEAYHGDTAGDVSVGFSDVFHRGLEPMLFDAIRVAPPHLAGEAESLRLMREALARHGDELAAVVIEPRMQGAAGMWPHSDGWLRQVAAMVRASGALLICDEVAVGFGRTGDLFASAGAGVAPDILALGKGISGGYLPLSATLATEEIFERFTAPYGEHRTFYYGHTYSANPVACAVARASLRLFDDEGTLQHAVALAAHLGERLQGLAAFPMVKEVRQQGTMVGVELQAADGRALDPAARTGRALCLAVRRHGVVLRPLGDVVVMNPPLVMSLDEADVMVDALEQALVETSPIPLVAGSA